MASGKNWFLSRAGLFLRNAKTIPSPSAGVTDPAPLPPVAEKVRFVESTARRDKAQPEPPSLPECTNDEYNEFLDCLKRGDRRFQKARYTLHDEYTAWLKDRRKRLALAQAAAEKAASASSS